MDIEEIFGQPYDDEMHEEYIDSEDLRTDIDDEYDYWEDDDENEEEYDEDDDT